VVLYLMLAATPFDLLFGESYSNWPNIPIPGLPLPNVPIEVIGLVPYAVMAIWALLLYRQAETRTQRLILLSIVIDTALIDTIWMLIWIEPQLKDRLLTILTVLGYLFAILVIWAFIIVLRSKRYRRVTAGR
jgi:hypothetical protein